MSGDNERETVSINSYFQSGGITAHTVNIGTQQRRLSESSAAELLSLLKMDRPIEVECIDGDAESMNYATEVKNFLLNMKYQVRGMRYSRFTSPVRGQAVRNLVGYDLVLIGSA